jgi:glucose-6-phosphate 1-dehydrogenase
MSKDAKTPVLAPAIIVIFGITGDLAQKKLLPTLYHLAKANLLDEHTEIVGITRRSVTAKELLDNVELCVNEIDGLCDPAAMKRMHELVSMQQVDLTSGDDYTKLKEHLDALEEQHGVCMNRLYYLSIPPQVFSPIVRLLGTHGMNSSCQHGTAATRLLIEKPFGYDVVSSRELIGETAQYFGEEQIFRIDHYVAKETVQNILTFRFTNPLFASTWNAEHIERITILAKERIGIEGRVTFYEETGALRDFIQSHLLQLLAILTMDQPDELTAESIHANKLKLLKAVKPISSEAVARAAVRGQYEGYRTEVSNPHSHIETFAAIRTTIDSPCWKDVPVVLLTGKGIDAGDPKVQKLSELRVDFKPLGAQQTTNTLCFRIQPDEGISLELQVKKPGFEYETQEVEMEFTYQQAFNDNGHPDAYERVLVDAVRGDHTLFATSEEVLAAWDVVEAVVQHWSRGDNGLELYKFGSDGPKSAEELFK